MCSILNVHFFPSCLQIAAVVCMDIGLLVPFGAIDIMNWILFILIFINLVCKPNVREETSKNGSLRKLKENFMIALGLSLLFGMGWAIGLLATSDLPDAVRYPAEWVFTLTTAFLGVYLFVLHVLKPQKSKSRLTSTLVSWAAFRRNTLREAGKSTDKMTHNTPAASENLYSPSSLTGRTTDITSMFNLLSHPLQWRTPLLRPHLPICRMWRLS